MVVDLRMPSEFVELKDDPIIDAEHFLDPDIGEKIMGKPLFSCYPAYDFNGKIWWHDVLGYWAIEIWQFKKYKMTLLNEHLDELVKETQAIYGNR